MTKVAFVTPWFGEALPGGSETLARTTAHHLRQAGTDVEILSTCIRDLYDDWGRNHHPPGTELVNDLPVRRFAVEKRRTRTFNRLNRRLGSGKSLTTRQARTFINQMFVVPSLYQYIDQHRQDYWFLFIPYMFASTYHGVLTVPERALVIPCLHDEPYARLPLYRDMLRSARGLLFNTDAEAALAESLLGPVDGQLRRVMGDGIDTDVSGNGMRFRQRHQISGSLVLYAGRREEGKNVPLLIDYWKRFAALTHRDATLVLIGSQSPRPAESDGGVLDLGFVSQQDKYDAFAAADVLCQPSVNESFSLVLMESWVQGTPVLVNGDCAVTRQHCERSQGGLTFSSFPEFATALTRLLDDPGEAGRMGQLGRQYVLDNYQWPSIVARFHEVIAEIEAA